VAYLARGRGYALFLTKAGPVLQMHPSAISRQPSEFEIRNPKSEIRNSSVRIEFLGGNPKPEIVGVDQLPGVVNYLIGNDPTKWRRGVPTYAKVRYREVYPGIDVVFYGSEGKLEYDFVVAPGADPGLIRLAFTVDDPATPMAHAVPPCQTGAECWVLSAEGKTHLAIDGNGNLIIHTAAGEIRQRLPLVYQEVEGARQPVDAGYSLFPALRTSHSALSTPHSALVVGFQLASYDPILPLVIDPTIDFASYLGGSGVAETLDAMAVDAAGNIYLTGGSVSADFPGATNSPNAGSIDIFITKLSAAGSLLSTTFLGGSSTDGAADIAVDADGNIYLTGQTTSTNFPTVGGFQTTKTLADADVFVTRLNSGGTITYSTFLIGSGTDFGTGIDVSAGGEILVTGETNSSNFPIRNAFQTTGASSSVSSAFVTKINPNVGGEDSLSFSTFLGGSNVERGADIAVSGGSVWVVGETFSTDFPGGSGGTVSEAFIAKFGIGGLFQLGRTFGGDGQIDSALAVTADGAGNAYVTGVTNSGDFPIAGGLTLPPPIRQTPFFIMFDTLGEIRYSTLFSGRGGQGRAIDVSGSQVWLAATEAGVSFVPRDPLPGSEVSGTAGIVVTQIDVSKSGDDSHIFSSVIPGTGILGALGLSQGAEGIAVRGNTVVVAGNANARVLPTFFQATPDAFQPELDGQTDGYVVILGEEGAPPACPIELPFTTGGGRGATGPQCFVVNSVADRVDQNIGNGICDTAGPPVQGSPECTLRAAIQEANNTAEKDAIVFAIPGSGPHSIRPASALPTVTQPVFIDGATEPDFSGTPVVEVNGSMAGSANGLVIAGGNTLVKGLMINRFSGDGLVIDTKGTNVIEGNIIGTDVAGARDAGNENGIVLIGAPDNRIGGTTAAARNVISGNSGTGLVITAGAQGNTVLGNFIGTNLEGTDELGNGGAGVSIVDSANNTMGGTRPSGQQVAVPPGNVVSGNDGGGIVITGAPSRSNKVQGNLIGTDRNGGAAVANEPNGLLVESGANFIGTAPDDPPGMAAGNVISGNAENGVVLKGSAAAQTRVSGNLIGTNQAGTIAVANGASGVLIDGGSDCVVGGAVSQPGAAPGNLISGNGAHGIAVQGASSSGNRLEGNLIGTTLQGTAPLGNTAAGVSIDGAPGNVVGGETAAQRNVISANRVGVMVSGDTASNNKILGNFVGTRPDGGFDASEQLGNREQGVLIHGARDNLVGDSTDTPGMPPGNVVSVNGSADVNGAANIAILGAVAGNNRVAGNIVGLDPTGMRRTSGLRRIGVLIIDGLENTIGGDETRFRNVISAHTEAVRIEGGIAFRNRVRSNFIGTDITGRRVDQDSNPNNGNEFSNRIGVHIVDATSALIGGETSSPGTAPGNLISGVGEEGGVGVRITADNPSRDGNNQVLGNLIGTDIEGTAALPHLTGVELMGTMGNTIGGSTEGSRNVISGNVDNGVAIRNAQAARVLGNFIGTSRGGDAALRNGDTGVLVASSSGTIIGGLTLVPTTAPGNIISNPLAVGIALDESPATRVQGNIIGLDINGVILTDATGQTQVSGIIIEGASADTLIGGSTAGEGNVISGHSVHGINIESDGIRVEGNLIGKFFGDLIPRRNGVGVGVAGNDNSIGGTTPSAGNTIAFSSRTGVEVRNGRRNSILGNDIFSNLGLGIDLGANGVTQNDLGDLDPGPNDLQNFPVLTSVTTSGAAIAIEGTLSSIANTRYRIELFANPACDQPSGFGEGTIFKGATEVVTRENGDARFDGANRLILAAAVEAGGQVTATATRIEMTAEGPTLRDTSEFSACTQAVAGDVPTPAASNTPTTTPTFTPTATATATSTPTPTSTPSPTPTPTPIRLSMDIHPIQVIQDPPGADPDEEIALVREKNTMVRVFVTGSARDGTVFRNVIGRVSAGGLDQEIEADLHFSGGNAEVVPIAEREIFDSGSIERRFNFYDAFNFEFPRGPDGPFGVAPQGPLLAVEASLRVAGVVSGTDEQEFPLRPFTDTDGNGQLLLSFHFLETSEKPLLTQPAGATEGNVNPAILTFIQGQFDQLVAAYPVPHRRAMFRIDPRVRRFLGLGPDALGLFLEQFEQSLSRDAASGVDRFVFITPAQTEDRRAFNTELTDAIAGRTTPPGRENAGFGSPTFPEFVFIRENGPPFVLAHENTHRLENRYAGADPTHNAGPADDGWDVRHAVNARVRKRSDFQSFMNPVSSSSTNEWADREDYDQLLMKLTSAPGLGVTTRGLGTEAVVFVAGHRDPDGSIALAPFFTSQGVAPSDVPDGDFTARTLNASGTALSEESFSLDSVSFDQIGEVFGFHLPFPPETAAIQITNLGAVVAERDVSANAPTLMVTSLEPIGGDRYRLALTAGDADGDPLSFGAAYTPDGDQLIFVELEPVEDGTLFEFDASMLPGSDEGRVQVTVTDGVNTARSLSPPAAFPFHAPSVAISAPADGAPVSATVPLQLRGIAYDLEDGLLVDDSLRWTSDRDGDLGTGELLAVDALTAGEHTIALAATDSDGTSAMTSHRVTVLGEAATPEIAVRELTLASGPPVAGTDLTLLVRVQLAGPDRQATVSLFAGDPSAGGELLVEEQVGLLGNAEGEVVLTTRIARGGPLRLFARAQLAEGEEPNQTNNQTFFDLTIAGGCLGDCNSNGAVTVDELITGVNIALGTLSVDQCPVFDGNGDGQVTVDELITAVNNALTGCPA
jgi:CSLREA domain-containing protein